MNNNSTRRNKSVKNRLGIFNTTNAPRNQLLKLSKYNTNKARNELKQASNNLNRYSFLGSNTIRPKTLKKYNNIHKHKLLMSKALNQLYNYDVEEKLKSMLMEAINKSEDAVLQYKLERDKLARNISLATFGDNTSKLNKLKEKYEKLNKEWFEYMKWQVEITNKLHMAIKDKNENEYMRILKEINTEQSKRGLQL